MAVGAVMMNESFETTQDYWDCECDTEHYIHPQSQERCNVCEARHDEQPDSRVDEVGTKLGIEPRPESIEVH